MANKEKIIRKILNKYDYINKEDESYVYNKLMGESPLSVAYIQVYLEYNYINEHDLLNYDCYMDMLDYIESNLL